MCSSKLLHSHRGRSSKPIFVQIAKQVVSLNPLELRLPSRAWKVKLVGEGADDAGGVFDDTITEMCQVGWIKHWEGLRATEAAKYCSQKCSLIFSLFTYVLFVNWQIMMCVFFSPGAAVWCGGSSDSYSQQLCRCGQQHWQVHSLSSFDSHQPKHYP